MKEQMERLRRNFNWGAFLSIFLMMTGACLLIIALVASLINASWVPLLLLIPGVMSFAVAAGVTM